MSEVITAAPYCSPGGRITAPAKITKLFSENNLKIFNMKWGPPDLHIYICKQTVKKQKSNYLRLINI